jgi:hypothetical protein
MQTQIKTKLPDNGNLNRRRNMMLSVIHIEESLMETRKEKE